MAAIDQIVTVNISQATASVAQANFGIPLIVGPTAPGWAATDYVHTYSAPSGMLTDGFTTSSPEYISAVAMFSQSLTPSQFLVGKRASATSAIATDIANIVAQNNTWYGLAIAQASDADILAAATAIEGLKKIYIAVSNTAAVSATGTTDVAATLQTKGFKRTALVYSPANFSSGIDAAWLGVMLPTTPGSSNWAFKALNGIAADSLTANQQAVLIGNPVAALQGKNVNIYQNVGGVNITQMGTMAGGQFIDLTVGIDWLQATLQSNIFSFLANAPKVPYTNKGVAMIMSAVKAALDLGVANGLFDGASALTVSAQSVATVTTAQRASRVAPTITFSARFAGALNAVVVNGTVTV